MAYLESWQGGNFVGIFISEHQIEILILVMFGYVIYLAFTEKDKIQDFLEKHDKRY